MHSPNFAEWRHICNCRSTVRQRITDKTCVLFALRILVHLCGNLRKRQQRAVMAGPFSKGTQHATIIFCSFHVDQTVRI